MSSSKIREAPTSPSAAGRGVCHDAEFIPVAPKKKESKKGPPLIILADTREQRIPPFPEGCIIQRDTISEGDYSTPGLKEIVRLERKSASDFMQTLSRGRERFDREVVRLKPFKYKAIIVEADLLQCYRESPGVHPHAVLGSLASWWARYDLPTFFAGNETGAGRLMAGILRRLEERYGLREESR